MGSGRQEPRLTELQRRTHKCPKQRKDNRFVMGQRRETGPLQVIAEAQQNSRCVRQSSAPQRGVKRNDAICVMAEPEICERLRPWLYSRERRKGVWRMT